MFKFDFFLCLLSFSAEVWKEGADAENIAMCFALGFGLELYSSIIASLQVGAIVSVSSSSSLIFQPFLALSF